MDYGPVLTLDFEFHVLNGKPHPVRARNSRRTNATCHGKGGEKFVEHGSWLWCRRLLPRAHVDGLSLSAGLCAVYSLVRRNQHIGHAFGQLHIQQAVVDGCLAVGIPQQIELGAAATLVT